MYSLHATSRAACSGFYRVCVCLFKVYTKVRACACINIYHVPRVRFLLIKGNYASPTVSDLKRESRRDIDNLYVAYAQVKFKSNVFHRRRRTIE